MKKTVILILALLPIVLVITIAFAGKILSIYHHIAVEKVDFVNELGVPLDDEFILYVNAGESKPTTVRVLPEMASNPKVSYVSQDETICTVDAEGNVTGVAVGGTTVLVKSLEGGKTDMLNVVVTADAVTGVTLPQSALTMTVGETQLLTPTVQPYTALNKAVTFTTDNPDVIAVSAMGHIAARAIGTATVTVTTADGNYTATCTVTVEDGTPPLSFDASAGVDIVALGEGYYLNTDTIDLAPFLICDTNKIDPATVQWRIAAGNDVAAVTGSTVTFAKKGLVTVEAFVGNVAAPTYFIQIKLLHQ